MNNPVKKILSIETKVDKVGCSQNMYIHSYVNAINVE
jgi:hypothetical protein